MRKLLTVHARDEGIFLNITLFRRAANSLLNISEKEGQSSYLTCLTLNYHLLEKSARSKH